MSVFPVCCTCQCSIPPIAIVTNNIILSFPLGNNRKYRPPRLGQAHMQWYLALAILAILPVNLAFQWCETNRNTGCTGRAKRLSPVSCCFPTGHEKSLKRGLYRLFQKFFIGFVYMYTVTTRTLYCFISPSSNSQVYGEGGNPFTSIPVTMMDDAIVIDWDKDGDLDVIVAVNTLELKASGDLRYFEKQLHGEYKELKDTNPFKDIHFDISVPAIVDWDGDGRLDVVASGRDSTDGTLRFFQRQPDGSLLERTGSQNPFSSITGDSSRFVLLSAGDWDGDGDQDLLVGHASGLTYYEQRDGVAVRVANSSFPSIKRSAYVH